MLLNFKAFKGNGQPRSQGLSLPERPKEPDLAAMEGTQTELGESTCLNLLSRPVSRCEGCVSFLKTEEQTCNNSCH